MNENRELTLTGKICYVFMCMERYLVNVYPDRDWTPVAKRMWQWTTHWWDESWDIYSEVVPEYIMEFDTYEETNERAFEGKLAESDYRELISLFKGLTDGKGNDELNRVLKIPIDFGNICEGTSVTAAEPGVEELITELEGILQEHGIHLPDKAVLHQFEYEKGKKAKVGEKELGWGDFENTEFLSIILEQSNEARTLVK